MYFYIIVKLAYNAHMGISQNGEVTVNCQVEVTFCAERNSFTNLSNALPRWIYASNNNI